MIVRMKRVIINIVLMLLLIPMGAFGQTYGELWKQVEDAQAKDLPQTAMAVLKKIESKAGKEKDYGQLLKATLLTAKLQAEIAPDSMQIAVERIENGEWRIGLRMYMYFQVIVDGKLRLAQPLVGALHLSRVDVHPSHQSHGFIEQQIALGLPATHQQHGILVGQVLTGKPVVVHIVEDIHIMYQDGFVVAKQVLCLFQSPTRFQQLFRLVANQDLRGEWREVRGKWREVRGKW